MKVHTGLTSVLTGDSYGEIQPSAPGLVFGGFFPQNVKMGNFSSPYLPGLSRRILDENFLGGKLEMTVKRLLVQNLARRLHNEYRILVIQANDLIANTAYTFLWSFSPYVEIFLLTKKVTVFNYSYWFTHCEIEAAALCRQLDACVKSYEKECHFLHRIIRISRESSSVRDSLQQFVRSPHAYVLLHEPIHYN